MRRVMVMMMVVVYFVLFVQRNGAGADDGGRPEAGPTGGSGGGGRGHRGHRRHGRNRGHGRGPPAQRTQPAVAVAVTVRSDDSVISGAAAAPAADRMMGNGGGRKPATRTVAADADDAVAIAAVGDDLAVAWSERFQAGLAPAPSGGSGPLVMRIDGRKSVRMILEMVTLDDAVRRSLLTAAAHVHHITIVVAVNFVGGGATHQSDDAATSGSGAEQGRRALGAAHGRQSGGHGDVVVLVVVVGVDSGAVDSGRISRNHQPVVVERGFQEAVGAGARPQRLLRG